MTKQQKKMKKNVLISGFIIGAILCANIFYTVNLCYTNPDFKGNMFLGFAAMIIAFSPIFFGVRNYRNKQFNGEISFGKAFQAGALIALTASTLYVVAWLFYYYLFVPDFIDQYTVHVLKNADASDLAAKNKEMAELKEMYKNPVLIVLITYMEVLPVGLIVALVSSLILKKKHQLPEAP